MVDIHSDRLGFALRNSQIRNGIFIPKYYVPEVEKRLEVLSITHHLVQISDLVEQGHIELSTGHEIGKMAYGTGNIPFVRTSDIGTWEIKADPKQGISPDIYQEYAENQDVHIGDIFFVRDGTYLIGQTAMVTELDIPCLYQSHILKIRVKPSCPVSRWLLFAALNAPTVRKQIRAKQFTADIIDTIGNRFKELILPIPKDPVLAAKIADDVMYVIQTRVQLLKQMKKIPQLVLGDEHDFLEDENVDIPPAFGLPSDLGFAIKLSSIQSNIFIPKYYDLTLKAELNRLSNTHELVSLEALSQSGIISWDTGIEVGKMAYGTGYIPFVRTSDISNWELKGDPKQNVSELIYQENKQDVEFEDIFIVRDGTYLVGTSCILTVHDTKLLYCGGLYKIRVHEKDRIDPYLLLAVLNTAIVRRQMRTKQFTRDIIDTLGKRLFEVVIPIPKDKEARKRIAEETRDIIETRVRLRNRAKEIALEIEGNQHIPDEELNEL